MELRSLLHALAWLGATVHIMCKFFFISAADGSSHSAELASQVALVHHLSKGIPIAAMAVATFAEGTKGSTYRTGVAFGLVLSLAGDILLLPIVDVFIGGLAAFLLAHIAYIWAITEGGLSAIDMDGNSPDGGMPGILLLVPFGGYAYCMFNHIRPHVEDPLLGPVAAYATIIGVMGWVAAARATAKSSRSAADHVSGAGGMNALSARVATVGAMMFIVSDSLLAFGKFDPTFKGHQGFTTRIDLGVMITYYIAQALIALSAERWGHEDAPSVGGNTLKAGAQLPRERFRHTGAKKSE